ncbi:LacI family DNA-binding transcriptional regulator [Vallitalea okinawensis]|uniref:LacI family DNA-binding transcriptional regulator n=1 Tax=Vallitalea okinawensis TaxID=2078660 RepID=UPI000CFB10FC|nr:LacI family DNA-binding transcriptional regulator [Vallitalea okinawensis]
MKITINDIAKAANVSKSTVSKVINDSPTISDETKKRVHNIMKEMNYIPNPYATQLAKQNSKTVGLFVNASHQNHFQDPFFYSIIGGVESTLMPDNYEINVANINSIKDADDFFRKYVYNRKYCGLILPIDSLNDTFITKLKASSVPFIIIGASEELKDSPSVDINNKAAGETVTLHLLDQGNRHIAYLGRSSQTNPLSRSRIEGYKTAFTKYNLSLDDRLISEKAIDDQWAHKEVIRIYQENPLLDSVVCEDNYLAYGALKALKEMKLRVPQDIAVVTFNNYPLAPYLTPPMTCVHMDTFELGRQVGQSLLEKIKKPDIDIQTHLIRPQLIIRESSIRSK